MTKSIDQIREALSEFDGRALTILSEAEARFSNREDYLDCLIALSGESGKGISNGATWLLKSHLDGGAGLSENQTSRWLYQANLMDNWAAQLHLCQSVQHLAVLAEDAEPLVEWLQSLLVHKRPFLRAWSLDALYRVSVQHIKYDDVVRAALNLAEKDPAASVRARARNLVN